MNRAFFVTGTDTDVGKTFVGCALLHAWRALGLSAAAYKPISAGAELVGGVLRNEDALRLHAAGSPIVSLDEINPVCLPEAIAPHIAARRAGAAIDVAQLERGFEVLTERVQRLVVEGAGGFLVPIDEQLDMAHLACRLDIPVIMVVGLRLGCLNHAMLTAEAIASRGLHLAAWIANTVDAAMPCFDENVAYLRARLSAPCLGVVPRLASPEQADAFLDLTHIES